MYAFCKCRFIPPHQSLTRQLPPKGKPLCKIPFALHDKATRANRKGKPQLKDIFDISAMYATFAVFAQCKEGFPLGGKKTASSLARKRLMRGDKFTLPIGMYLRFEAERHMGRSLQHRIFDGLCLTASALCRALTRRERPVCRSVPINN